MLTSSSGTNYAQSDHEDVGQYGPYASLLYRNRYWVNMLTSSSGTNYAQSDHEDVGQYGLYAIPSEVMPWYSYPASLVNQNKIPIDLLC